MQHRLDWQAGGPLTAKLEDKVGGKAEFGFDKRGTVFHMKIDKLVPAKQVVWSCHGDAPEWDGTTLTWELSPQGEGTTLRFTHGNWKPRAALEGMSAERNGRQQAWSTRH